MADGRQEAESARAALKGQLTEVQQRAAALEKQVEDVRKASAAKDKELTGRDEQLAALKAQVATAREETAGVRATLTGQVEKTQAEVAALKPDAFYVFLPGNSAWKFMKDYAASGLKGKVPIYGNWITDNTIEVPGSVAEDTLTVLHYGDDLPVKKNNLFREAYKRAYNVEPDVYNVEGYDTAELLDIGLSAVKGDVSKKDQMIQAMESAKLDSPRGPMRLSKAHHPIQDFYLRKVQGNKNTVIATAVQQLSDPGRGCAVMDDKK